ncbi:hypothetical protein OBBRIDRAFT_884451 [Obba rivulosa]|uniref:Mannosyltransferase n=1 Tax=Obba rivulosa TaxID=1052685 RepID=A0A8E2DSL4_9APHY|nr:hypothetical protein OBBRIDRAFT_884451 [Obba rivulosa]
MSTILDVLTLAIASAHVVLAPYSKVEESFNLHATHDVLMYGVRPASLPNYDHFVFPGAVPRTFVGSVLLAWLSQPLIRLACLYHFVHDKSDLQVIVRLVLATANALGFCLLRRAVSRRFGGPASVLFTLLTCTQFHVPFWMGRTLPNTFALLPVNLALYLLVNRASNSTRPSESGLSAAMALLTFTAVVFRAEISLLLAPLVLQSLVCRHTTLGSVVKIGLVCGLSSIALTIGVDSYFWQQWPLWPEFYGLYFNVLQGKSSEWGVSPFHVYFTAHLPKLLLSALPLSLVGTLVDGRIQALLLPPIAFLILISGLGHKEWRFVVYVVPLFNIAAARGATWLISRRKGTLFGRLCFLSVAGLLAGNCLATVFLTRASMANYPGGHAMAQFNEIYGTRDHVHVHISNLAAQTGASLFLHTNAPPYPTHLCSSHNFPSVARQRHWVYNKTEHVAPSALGAAHDVTHAIAEVATAAELEKTDVWTAVSIVDGFDRWQLNREVLKGGLLDAAMRVVEMIRSPRLIILEKR